MNVWAGLISRYDGFLVHCEDWKTTGSANEFHELGGPEVAYDLDTRRRCRFQGCLTKVRIAGIRNLRGVDEKGE